MKNEMRFIGMEDGCPEENLQHNQATRIFGTHKIVSRVRAASFPPASSRFGAWRSTCIIAPPLKRVGGSELAHVHPHFDGGRRSASCGAVGLRRRPPRLLSAGLRLLRPQEQTFLVLPPTSEVDPKRTFVGL